MDKAIGHWAFFLGVLVAVLAGFFPDMISTTSLILVVLGLVVGFLNVSGKESTPFLVAAIALIVAGSAGVRVITFLNLGTYLGNILSNIGAFVAPAAVIVALETVVALAKE